MRENKNDKWDKRQEKRHAILAALAKTGSEMNVSYSSTDELDDGTDSYYTMTKDELEALISGNLETIERWVSNLDRPHATWLLRWLIKESR